LYHLDSIIPSRTNFSMSNNRGLVYVQINLSILCLSIMIIQHRPLQPLIVIIHH
jgi:hypothetical protein